MSALSRCRIRGWRSSHRQLPERVVPAIVEFVDIAGLVAGASTGEGLGNKFGPHIRETDATITCRRFADDKRSM